MSSEEKRGENLYDDGRGKDCLNRTKKKKAQTATKNNRYNWT